jgi:hypothetical protein
MDKLNRDYNEKLILFNMQRKIQKILLNKNNNFQIENYIKKPDKQKRIILKDIFKINQSSKDIQYNFIFSYSLNDDKIYLVTLFRKK